MRTTDLWPGALIGIVIGAVLVAVTFFIGDALSGPLRATGPDGEMADVPLANGIFTTVLAGVIGTGLAFFLRKRSNAANLFLGICGVIVVLYGIFAFTAADNVATGIWLNLMHIAAAIPIVGALTQWLRRQAVAAPTNAATA